MEGRWEKVARAMADHYGIKAGDKILDVGCGKGFLLYDFTKVVPGVDVTGIDISPYAIANAKEEIKDRFKVGNANRPARSRTTCFDLVYFLYDPAQSAQLRSRPGAA